MTDRRKLDDPLAAPLASALAAGLDRSGRDCPEAETLALYFDHALAADETARWEPHFATCARCQAQLAAMARMETAPGPVAQEAARHPSGVSWRWNWRWLAPAAAALGALAIWVVVNNFTTRPSPAGPTIAQQVTQEPAAKTSQSAASAKAEGLGSAADTVGNEAAAFDPGRSAPGLASEAGSKLASKPVEEPTAKLPTAAAGDDVATHTLSDRFDAARVAKSAERNIVGAQQSAAKSDARKDTPSESASRVEPQKAKEEAALEGETRAAGIATMTQQAQQPAAGETMQQKSVAPAQLPSSQRPNEQDARAAREAFEKRQEVPAQAALDESKKAQAEPVGQLAQVVTVESGPAAVNRLRAKPETGGRFKAANVAGSKVVWRLGPGGSIERSADGGATWQRQVSGVTADLLAGSAPSLTVCWAVGRGGVVLRTTDGSTWSQVVSPTAQDLTAIVAVDAEQATVTAADGKRYATTDGGRTWRSL